MMTDYPELQRLRAVLHDHNRRYYTLDEPAISDAEYDSLFRRLLALEQAHPEWIAADSPSQRVGAALKSAFQPQRHWQAMYSLDNAFTAEAMTQFAQRLEKRLQHPVVEYFGEPKLDGVAISLRYENRRLQDALTRGDGITGETVTANIRTLPCVPLVLDDGAPTGRLEIRGEVYLPYSGLTRLNRQREQHGEAPLANPRNAAAGSLRQLDPAITAQRPLALFAYALGECPDSHRPDSQRGLYRCLQQWGLPVNPLARTLHGLAAVMDFIDSIQAQRHGLDYAIDGVVVKVNDLNLHAVLGETARAPRWAIAWKFPADEADSRVLGINIQVGRSGVLTPVAQLQPVEVAGVVVQRATLHNASELARKDVRIGDRVRIRRAGDVIPELIGVDTNSRPADCTAFVFPSHCPACGSPVVQDDDKVAIRCPNRLGCPAQLSGAIRHFASRRAMDIQGLGSKLVQHLVASERVRRLSDLYALSLPQLTGLERMGKRSAQNLLDAIAASQQAPLWRLLHGLGMPHVGEETAKLLSQHYTLNDLKNARAEELETLDGIGPIVARELVQRLAAMREEVERLQQYWREPDPTPTVAPSVPATSSHPLYGKRVAISGKIAGLSRDQIVQKLEDVGAIWSKAVNRRTDILLIGDKAGSKQAKAEQLGIEMMSAEAFNMLFP